MRLINPSTEHQCSIPKDARLSVHSLVNPALIPLYARVGPSFEVHSTDIETSRWLKSRLLSNIWLEEDELERCQLLQCPVGLLVSIENTKSAQQPGCNTSDLLIYGTLSSSLSPRRSPFLPTSSFPNDQEDDLHPVVKRELKIYALPLSASLITKSRGLPSPPLSPASNNVDRSAEFAELISGFRSPSPKRKRLSSLFETAAQHHKRVRQRGGEAVSQLMANTNSQTLPQLTSLKVKRDNDEPSHNSLEGESWRRSRSLSISGSLRLGKRSDGRIENARPTTARSQLRDSISRTSTPNPFPELQRQFSTQSSVFATDGEDQLTSKQKDDQRTVSDNRALITRTILTCMRLYGFHRSAVRSSSVSKYITSTAHPDLDGINDDNIAGPPAGDTGLSASVSSGSDEDEFKAMYHATYKAATFALRKYLKEHHSGGETVENIPPILAKERVTNLVDELLRLFCEDS